MIIRKCELSDLASVYCLIKKELDYPDIAEASFQERLKKMMELGNYSVYVAETNGVVCGFISTVTEFSLEVEGEFLRIIGLAVKTEFQRSGIGSALLMFAEDNAVKNGYGVITLSSNFKRAEAHKFYEKMGYGKTSYTFKKFI